MKKQTEKPDVWHGCSGNIQNLKIIYVCFKLKKNSIGLVC